MSRSWSIRVAGLSGAVRDRVAGDVLQALSGFLDPLTGGPAGLGWPFGRDVAEATAPRRRLRDRRRLRRELEMSARDPAALNRWLRQRRRRADDAGRVRPPSGGGALMAATVQSDYVWRGQLVGPAEPSSSRPHRPGGSGGVHSPPAHQRRARHVGNRARLRDRHRRAARKRHRRARPGIRPARTRGGVRPVDRRPTSAAPRGRGGTLGRPRPAGRA